MNPGEGIRVDFGGSEFGGPFPQGGLFARGIDSGGVELEGAIDFRGEIRREFDFGCGTGVPGESGGEFGSGPGRGIDSGGKVRIGIQRENPTGEERGGIEYLRQLLSLGRLPLSLPSSAHH